MRKTSHSEDFDFGQPIVEILKVSSRGPDGGWFEKRASFLNQSRSELKPVKGHTPVFIIAMGAGEYFSSNRNADYWPKTKCVKVAHTPAHGNGREMTISAGLQEQHPTFVSHGKIYKNHNNSDQRLAKGFLKSSFFNAPLGRVELIGMLKDSHWQPQLAALDRGEHISTSMSASVPYDFCSYCANKATSRREYCEHLKHHKNAILDDGFQITAINEKPTFTDLSVVIHPADRISYGLAKIDCQSGDIKTAGFEDLSHRTREAILLEKLAKIEKEIECGAIQDLPALARSVDKRDGKDLTDKEFSVVKSHKVGPTLKFFASRKVIFPPKHFFRIALGDDFPEIEPMLGEIERMLPGIFGRMQDSGRGTRVIFKGSPEEVDTMDMRDVAKGMMEPYSLRPDITQIRIAISSANHEDRPKVKQEKKEASDQGIEALARDYAGYMLSCLNGFDEPMLKLAVLRNYLEG
jgi:hypothetical protein